MKKRERKIKLFFLPAVVLMLFFVVYPFFQTVYISLCKWNGYSAGSLKWAGIGNYIDMLSDKRFWGALRNTIIYGFGSTAIQNIIGLLIALFVNTGFKGNRAVRAVVYMPIMISGLIMGYIMYFFLTYDRGVLNDFLLWLSKEPVDWLADGNRGIVLITAINSWQYAGNCMIIYLAGLQGVPAMYKEAAAIDGAGKVQIFFHIILPLLVPAMTTAIIINLIGGLKLFDPVISLTNGGPNHMTDSLMTYLNSQYFLKERAGYASAIGIVTFLLIMFVSVLNSRFFEKRRVEM